MLGILGSILFLKDIYRTYGELTLGDILTFLIIALTGPITLLALLTKYTVRISINFVGLIFRQCMIIVANVII